MRKQVWELMARKEEKLRTYLGRLLRVLDRKLPAPPAGIKELLANAKRIHAQKRGDKQKPVQRARAGGGMHRQGQGAQEVRIRLQFALDLPFNSSKYWRIDGSISSV
jgi:hypothetical protein